MLLSEQEPSIPQNEGWSLSRRLAPHVTPPSPDDDMYWFVITPHSGSSRQSIQNECTRPRPSTVTATQDPSASGGPSFMRTGALHVLPSSEYETNCSRM